MLNFKKMVSLMVCVLLVATLLISCKPADVTGNVSGDGYVPSKKLELTVWNTQGTDYIPKSINDDVVEKWLFEKTKVRVKNTYGNDGGQWDSKLTKLVAGNNLPDILWCQSGQGVSHFEKLKELKVLYEITPEMIQKYAPEVWKRTPESLWTDFTVDGKIMGIPFNLPVSQIEEISPGISSEDSQLIKEKYEDYVDDVTLGAIWVRDDILKMIYPEAKTYDELVALLEEKQAPIGEELLDVAIDTPEKYIDFMYKIKNLNLTEDGKKVYAYGYAGDGNDNWEAINYLGADMYGFKRHNYTATWNFETEKVEIPLTGELVKKAVKTQNEMINDGVIDPESLAHTIDQFKTKVYNGQYAICDMRRVGDTVTVNKQLEETGKKFKYRPLYTQVPSQKGYEPFKNEYKFSDSICFLNTLDEEEVIQVLNWVNMQYTSEFEDVYNWGSKEDGLYVEENGKRKFVDDRFTKYFVESDKSALVINDAKGLAGSSAKLYVIPCKYSKWTPDIYVGYRKYAPTVLSGFRFPVDSEHVTKVKTAPPCEAYASEFSAITEVIDYWGARENWEIAVKKAFAASKDEFETKWASAMETLNGIVDISEMERKMTEIAKSYTDEIE